MIEFEFISYNLKNILFTLFALQEIYSVICKGLVF